MNVLVRRAVILSLLLLAASTARAQKSVPLSDRIPPVNHDAYRQVRDAKQWKNPYLVVHRNGIEVIGITGKGALIPVHTLAEVLKRLPNSAWPYGRVVAVQDSSIQATGDAPQIKANRKKLLRLLHEMQIEVDPWPS